MSRFRKSNRGAQPRPMPAAPAPVEERIEEDAAAPAEHDTLKDETTEPGDDELETTPTTNMEEADHG